MLNKTDQGYIQKLRDDMAKYMVYFRRQGVVAKILDIQGLHLKGTQGAFVPISP